MPDPTLRIVIDRVLFTGVGRRQGSGQTRIDASVHDGRRRTAIGNSAQLHSYRPNRDITLNWSQDVNVRGKTHLDFALNCTDSTGRRLAEYSYRLQAPWRMFEHEVLSTPNAHVVWSVTPVREMAQTAAAPYAVSASRERFGSVHYTAVGGRRGEFCLEIGPVRPTPPDLQLPRRPLSIVIGTLLEGTQPHRNGLAQNVRPNDPINVIPNPAVIPHLDAPPARPPRPAPTRTQLDRAAYANHRNAARLECTYYWPPSERFTNNDRRLEWRKVGGAGDVAFIKYDPGDPAGSENRGLRVMVYGTTDGEVTLGVHFNNTLAAKYRAIVRPVKRLASRINILNGPPGPAHDRWRYTPTSTPAQAEAHMAIANRYLRQVALTLTPDANATITNAGGNRVTRTGRRGIFRIRVPQGDTRGVSDNHSEALIRYNHRPRVLNFFYIHSHTSAGTGGAAVFWPNSKLGAGDNRTITDNGDPSSSWIRRSGLYRDTPVGNITIRAIRGWPPPNTHPNLFGMFITNAMGSQPGGVDMSDYGCAIAHEVGHMLNLGHRVEQITNAGLLTQWNAGTLVPAVGGQIAQLSRGAGNLGANDGLWCDELWHPRLQNVMRWLADSYFNQDFDILQSKIVAESPLLDL